MLENDAQNTNNRIELLIRNQELDPIKATSFLNDSNYAYSAMRDLLGAARTFYIESEDAMAEVERILTLEDEELAGLVPEAATKEPEEAVR